MFCKYCGAPSETEVCPNCAAAQSQQPQQPQYQQPQAQPQAAQPVDFVALIKKNLNYIIVGVAALALLFGLLNVFSVLDVKGTVEMMGMSASGSGSLYDMEGSQAAPMFIGNILFGLTCLLAGAIGLLYFLKQTKNMPYYDQFLAAKVKSPLFAMGVVGAAGVILQNILYLLAGASGDYGTSVSYSVNWTTWLLLVIFVAIMLLDKLVLNKKAAPAQM